jgi:hypothetical protein
VQEDPKAVEIARIWATGGRQLVTLRTDLWTDPAAWGLMLTDLARHVAQAYAADKGLDPEQVLRRIKIGFDAEWAHPTDAPQSL